MFAKKCLQQDFPRDSIVSYNSTKFFNFPSLNFLNSCRHAGLASLMGNGLAVHVFRLKGTEINVPEVLLLNIAVVDLFLGIASYPATIVAAFSHRWLFGQTGTVTSYSRS